MSDRRNLTVNSYHVNLQYNAVLSYTPYVAYSQTIRWRESAGTGSEDLLPSDQHK